MKLQPNRLAGALAVALALSAGQVAAQTAAPSQNATVNLIRLLVQQGVLKQDQANALIQQAEAEAVQARKAAAAPAAAGGAGAAMAQPGDVRVPYIPATVRDQIRDEVKTEVMAQAKAENWAAPNTFPDWASRITVEGDVRFRDESRFFDSGNSDELIDFAKWNRNGPIPTFLAGQPYGLDIPYMNSRQDRRNLMRIRARLGVKAQLSEQWMAGIRLASGSDNSPVSTSDTLGGGMAKKDIWLDQAYLSYRPYEWATITAGRASSPFVSSDMLYSNDLNFDGISAAFKRPLGNGSPVTLFGSLGAYALEYSNNPFSSDTFSEGKSENKWLFGAQAGAEWKLNAQNKLRGAVAYYTFQNIEGQRSAPCDSLMTVCSTDWSRPAYMQKGNTLFLLRDVVQSSADQADWSEYQYVGLASKFNLLNLNLRWDTRLFDNLAMRLDGDYVRNLAYSKNKLISRAGGAANIVNSRENLDDIESGGNAWMFQATIGDGIDLVRKGDWMAFAGYKYIQPDALPDAYNDSTFHLGGTNARGYFLGGGYAFDKNVYGLLRWTSAKEIYGPPLAIDVLQLEVNARF
ncbi:Uncharacterised protein [Bordetella ansorpii]|uniref:Outer membrane receptor for ferric coprogen and ferric-rhodotorulic acid n=1 Tax=Bordetella ansorpii TaxID=288768 RepID=A0A157S587_9BORD|nr:putative porin [Bordetella ansorpii]SAI65572.1 Uncharacterised protein [Bordetella ansorpii]